MRAFDGPAPALGWIFYDDSCGFCSRWVGFWASTLAANGFATAPLQDEWVADKLGIASDELLRDIRLLTTDGQLLSGADVYLYVTRRILWAWPFYAVFSLPGFNMLIHFGYRWFAQNRHSISRSCNLNPSSRR